MRGNKSLLTITPHNPGKPDYASSCFRVLGLTYSARTFTTCSPADNRSEYLDWQFVELLLEQTPDERAGTFSTLEEAIAQHDRVFADR